MLKNESKTFNGKKKKIMNDNLSNQKTFDGKVKLLNSNSSNQKTFDAKIMLTNKILPMV